jgi:hypothetical protein
MRVLIIDITGKENTDADAVWFETKADPLYISALMVFCIETNDWDNIIAEYDIVARAHGSKVQKFVESTCRFCDTAKIDQRVTVPSQDADDRSGARLLGNVSISLMVCGINHVFVYNTAYDTTPLF